MSLHRASFHRTVYSRVIGSYFFNLFVIMSLYTMFASRLNDPRCPTYDIRYLSFVCEAGGGGVIWEMMGGVMPPGH